MKLKLNLKLTAKLVLSVLIPAVLILSLTQAYLGMKNFENAKKNGIEKVSAISHSMSAKVESYINQSFESVTVLRNSILALSAVKNPQREDVSLMMTEVVRNNPNYLAIWNMFEANAFDRKDFQYKKSSLYVNNDGRFSLTFYKDNNKLVNELANLDQYNEDYYTVPLKNMSNTLLEPYFYSYVGDTANQVFETSVIVPFIKDKKFIGAIAVDIELSILSKIIANDEIFKTGCASIITNDLQIASHPKSELVSKKLFTIINSDTAEIINSIKSGKEQIMYEETNDRGEILRYLCPININGTKTPWAVMIEVPMNEVTQEARNLILFLIIMNVLGMVLFAGFLIYISKSITKPILRAANYVNVIAKGDLTQTIVVNQQDEIGIMSQNLQQMTNKLRMVVSDIITNAENITLAGNELSNASQQLSEGANEQAASTEEVSSSMEEMVSNINQNADNASQTENIAIQAANDIEEGSKAVFATLDAMRKIAEKISIVGVIAEKTDLLAINAAIEAARAGEHGKGFAVVATEVRKLAERSQVAAKEIDELSKTSVRVADESGKVLMRIIPDIKKTSVLVQEISAASMEMNSGSNQINNALMQLNAVTQRNATASEEISSSAEELVGQSESLKEVVSFFKTGYEESRVASHKVNQNMRYSQPNVVPPTINYSKQPASTINLETYGTDIPSSDESNYEQY